jgi:hypothetical protein
MRRVTDVAGVPGTGLGGIFYVLLVIWMIIRQTCAPTTKDQARQWRRIVPLGVMAALIVIVVWIETWGISKVIGKLPTFGELLTSGTPSSGVLIIVLTLTPLLTLALLLLALHIARFLLPSEHARLQ